MRSNTSVLPGAVLSDIGEGCAVLTVCVYKYMCARARVCLSNCEQENQKKVSDANRVIHIMGREPIYGAGKKRF